MHAVFLTCRHLLDIIFLSMNVRAHITNPAYIITVYHLYKHRIEFCLFGGVSVAIKTVHNRHPDLLYTSRRLHQLRSCNFVNKNFILEYCLLVYYSPWTLRIKLKKVIILSFILKCIRRFSGIFFYHL